MRWASAIWSGTRQGLLRFATDFSKNQTAGGMGFRSDLIEGWATQNAGVRVNNF